MSYTRPIFSEEVPTPIGHYAPAEFTAIPNGTRQLAISGQLGLDLETGELCKGGVEEQTKVALGYVDVLLEEVGMCRTDVTRVTVYLYDLDDTKVVNSIYAEFFGNHKPARACIEISHLPKDADVEIVVDAVSYKDPTVIDTDDNTPGLFDEQQPNSDLTVTDIMAATISDDNAGGDSGILAKYEVDRVGTVTPTQDAGLDVGPTEGC